MISHTPKTIYCCLHDAPKYGDTPIIHMEIHKRPHISHKQLIEFRHKLEDFIEKELSMITGSMESFSNGHGVWPQ